VKTEDSIERFARPSTAIGMAVLVFSSFGWSVLRSPETRLEMLFVGTIYLGLSTVGWLWVERRGPLWKAAWLAALVALTLPALYVSYLGMFIIAMPMIGLAVIYGSIAWGVVTTVVYLAFAVAVSSIAWDYEPIRVYEASTGFLPGAIFTIVIARLIVRERDGRQQLRRYAAEVEELATTRERNRIARDIHDSVGHYLTVVNVQIEAARATASPEHLRAVGSSR
jgi:signal transduction histidine kinase